MPDIAKFDFTGTAMHAPKVLIGDGYSGSQSIQERLNTKKQTLNYYFLSMGNPLAFQSAKPFSRVYIFLKPCFSI
jgi:hypothetical protein